MIPGTMEFMKDCEFWIKRINNANRIIMDNEEIESFNDLNFEKSNSMCDIKKYPDVLLREELIYMIKGYEIPTESRFNEGGKAIGSDFYEQLVRSTNLDSISSSNEVRFGISVKNARVRSFPTDEGSYAEPGDIEFDLFQESECQAAEPVAILHESFDGQWLFVQMYNYNGWVRTIDIAIAKNRNQVFDYLDSARFLVVTGNKVTTQFNPYDARVSCKDFYMGTRLTLAAVNMTTVGNHLASYNHVVLLPVREENGMLTFLEALISKTEDVSFGYLQYTRENILKQAFKLLGDRYDWGSKNNGRDCSAFIMYVYKTFGIKLPRNADTQENCEGLHYEFSEDDDILKRSSILCKACPGAAIFMKGHVMMYIGEIDREPFMIHAFYKYGVKDGEVLSHVIVNAVAVTSTMLMGKKGTKFIEKFTSAVQFEKAK
jgi:hypothetical protein